MIFYCLSQEMHEISHSCILTYESSLICWTTLVIFLTLAFLMRWTHSHWQSSQLVLWGKSHHDWGSPSGISQHCSPLTAKATPYSKAMMVPGVGTITWFTRMAPGKTRWITAQFWTINKIAQLQLLCQMWHLLLISPPLGAESRLLILQPPLNLRLQAIHIHTGW